MSAVAAFISHVQESKRGGPRPRVKAKPLTPVQVAVKIAKARAISGDWSDAKPAAFVGLHCICHQMIYGITPLELDQQALFRAAARLAAKAQHELFNDDPHELAEFVRWSWSREKGKNTWAQQKQVERNRLNWRWQFSRSLVTDYRIAISQRRA